MFSNIRQQGKNISIRRQVEKQKLITFKICVFAISKVHTIYGVSEMTVFSNETNPQVSHETSIMTA